MRLGLEDVDAKLSSLLSYTFNSLSSLNTLALKLGKDNDKAECAASIIVWYGSYSTHTLFQRHVLFSSSVTHSV